MSDRADPRERQTASVQMVAVVTSTAQLGGGELSLLPVITRLAKEARVVALLPDDGPLAAKLLAAGAEVEIYSVTGSLRLASRQYGTRLSPALVTAAIAQQTGLARSLRRLRPEVVYCNGFRAQLAATFPAWTARARVVWHVRDFVGGGPSGMLWRQLARHVDLVIANSSATGAQPGLRHVRERLLIIWNGVDLALFRPRSAEPTGRPVIGMMGHLTAWKGHRRFLRLLLSLAEQHPGISGRIAGAAIYSTSDHAAYAEGLHAEVAALTSTTSCTIQALDNAQIPGWLRGLTVLVHCPDRPEPFGRALVEAMAVGVPVVAASGAEAAPILGDAGIAVPIGDEAALRSAVSEVLSDVGLRRGLAAAGPGRAEALFDENAYADRVARVLLRVGPRGSMPVG